MAARSPAAGLGPEALLAELERGEERAEILERLVAAGARRWEELPSYEVRDEGPDHDKRFFAEVRLGGEPVGLTPTEFQILLALARAPGRVPDRGRNSPTRRRFAGPSTAFPTCGPRTGAAWATASATPTPRTTTA